MPISAPDTSTSQRRVARHGRGFTLIEMLVVMVLLGLMGGLALPAMQRWFDAVQAKAYAAALVDAMRGAAFAAGATRRTIVVDAGSFGAAADSAVAAATPADPERLTMAMPPGWKLLRAEPAFFLASGLCRPGRLLMEPEPGRSLALVVHGPVCKVELTDATAATATTAGAATAIP